MEFSDYAFVDFYIFYTGIENRVYDISSLVFSKISFVVYHVAILGKDLVCTLKEYTSEFVE